MPNENADHIFLCQDPEIQRTFAGAIDELSDFLFDTTSIPLRNEVIRLLTAFREDLVPEVHTQENLAHLTTQQYDISMRATLNRMWHEGWEEEKRAYLQRMSSRKSARVWMIRLTLKIQYMIHKMWLTRN